MSIFRSCGLSKVVRAECSRRFRLRTASGNFALSSSQVTAFAAEVRDARPRAADALFRHLNATRAQVHDRMTECVYTTPLQSFASQVVPKPVTTIPVTTLGQAALEAINKVRGCNALGT